MATQTLKTRFGEIEVSKEIIPGDFKTIPVIDLANMESPDLEKRKAVAADIYEACARVGFFYIKNHGVSEDLIKNMHETAHKYFDLPLEKKMECFMGQSKSFRGYTPLLGGHQSTEVEDNPSGNLSEAFDIGYELAGDRQAKPDDKLPEDEANMYGNNLWPSEEIYPGFKDTFLNYYAEILDLGRRMLKIFALALDLPEDFFDSEVSHPGSLARIMHYPPQRVPAAQHEGISSHTDYECFTILSQDTVPALQVLNSNNQWIQAQPIPGTFVVNIGDTLKFWTNNVFKSTIHRATNLTGQQRYSIPFFFGVNYDTIITVLDKCITPENPAAEGLGPVNAGEYVRKQLSSTYVQYGEEEPDAAKGASLVTANAVPAAAA